MLERSQVLSVSELARMMANALATHCGFIRVKGELATFTPARSGHWYFTIKDEEAQFKAVMFRNKNLLAGFMPKIGDAVELSGYLDVYAARGDVQINVDVMKRSGIASLYEQFLQLKAKLAQEGLFDTSRKKPWPGMVFNVAVITSNEAAAWADVRQAMARRAPHVRLHLFHTQVQGDAAISMIANTLINADAGGFDALLLCRGGGSIEDLWAFNTEPVVRAVAQCKTPIIVGVGHESDVTLAELAADIRAATPTAAAELASLPTQHYWKQIDDLHQTLSTLMQHRLNHWAQRLDKAEIALPTPRQALQQCVQNTEQQARYLSALVHQRLDSFRHQFEILQKPLSSMLVQCLHNKSGKLEHFEMMLQQLSPHQVLARGYAMVTDADGGTVFTQAAQLNQGDAICLHLRDGIVDATVNGKDMR